jgi:CPA2 family monovalent cation:H+ antiporter-2
MHGFAMGESSTCSETCMHGSAEFVHSLAAVFCVAAVTTLLCVRLKLPNILGLIAAGMLVGPYGPAINIIDAGSVTAISELGVIFLMFTIGLELSLRQLFGLGLKPVAVALSGVGAVILVIFSTASLGGLAVLPALFLASSLAISSTMVVARTMRGEARESVLGVLVIEDVIAILMLTLMSVIASSQSLDGRELIQTLGRLLGFLLAMLLLGVVIVPRLIRHLVRQTRDDVLLVVVVGVCFAFALAASAFGYSVALGAFVAGALCAESGEGKRIERLTMPLRDLFAAVFFVSAGMLIDPSQLWQQRYWIVLLIPLVMLAKIAGVALGFFFTGHSIRDSVHAGVHMGQSGEFGLVLAALAATLGVSPELIFPVVLGVAVLTMVSTPLLAGFAISIANFVDAKLPRRVQTFAALYGSWIDRLKRRGMQVPLAKRLLRWVLIDAALLASLGILAALFVDDITRLLKNVGLGAQLPARWIAYAGFALVGVGIGLGLWRSIRNLGTLLAQRALPNRGEDEVDMAQAPRGAFVLTLQLGLWLVVCVPLLVVLQPFWPQVPGALVLMLLFSAAAFGFWRSTGELQAHARAGAQAVLEAFMHLTPRSVTPSHDPEVEAIESVLPGLGEFLGVRIEAEHRWAGQTLAQLNLRGLTGATILAIRRGESDVLTPEGREVLQTGDTLVAAGTRAALDALHHLYQQSA